MQKMKDAAQAVSCYMHFFFICVLVSVQLTVL